MKKLFFLCLFLAAGMTVTAAESRNIYCTTFPLYLFTRNITDGCKNVNTELIEPDVRTTTP